MSSQDLAVAGFIGEPWSRQPGETDRNYLAFCFYRDLGLSRSLAQANLAYRDAVQLPPKELADLPTKEISGWSGSFRWVERCSAYDDHLDAELLATAKRQMVRSAVKQARRAADAAEALSHPVAVYQARLEKIRDGSRYDQLDDLGDEDLVRLIRNATGMMPELHKAERDALRSTDSGNLAAPQSLRVRGELVRRIFSSPEAVGILEGLAFELSADGDLEALRGNGSEPERETIFVDSQDLPADISPGESDDREEISPPASPAEISPDPEISPQEISRENLAARSAMER